MKKLDGKPRSRMMLYLALLLIALSLCICTRQRSLPAPPAPVPSGGDTMDVAIEYSPMSLYRYADTLGGFGYDMMRCVADRLGRKIKFHPVASYTSALAGIDSGLYDVAVADVPSTTEIQTRYAVTEPVFLSRLVLVQRRDSAGGLKIGSQLELGGRTVYIPAGSPARQRLVNLASEIGDTIHVEEVPDLGNEQLFLLIEAGRIDFAVMNEELAASMAGRYRDVDVSTKVSFTQFQSWLLHRDNQALKAELDSAITAVKSTPDYPAIMKRYNLK